VSPSPSVRLCQSRLCLPFESRTTAALERGVAHAADDREQHERSDDESVRDEEAVGVGIGGFLVATGLYSLPWSATWRCPSISFRTSSRSRGLDDAIVVVVVLRTLFRRTETGLVREHWPGPQQSLELVLRLAGDG
jgi:hypothetical protein